MRVFRSLMKIFLAVIGFLILAPAQGEALEALTIRHVTVVPMTSGGEIVNDATVVIRGDRIEAVLPSGELPPKKGRLIDGRGKWLMPALADMHVHLENDRLARLYLHNPNIPSGTVQTADALLPYVANGVLQIAVLGAMSETLAQRDEVAAGKVLGPHIVAAAMIDGSPPILPVGVTRVAATPGDGRQAVRDAAVEGYDLIKVYSNLDLETFRAIADEARKLNLRVIGHLPLRQRGVTEKLFVPGFGMIAHAEELAMQTAQPALGDITRYAEWAQRNGTWLATTLTLDDRILEQMEHPESLKSRPEIGYLPPDLQSMLFNHNPYVMQANPGQIAYLRQVVEFNRKLVRSFAEKGVPIVAGTDALNPGIVPGFSLHDELEALAAAGLSNQSILESATRLPAEWLGTIGDRGEIVAGKRADLLLLDADPLQDVANTRRIAAVIAGGKYLSRKDLDLRMQALLEKRSIAGK